MSPLERSITRELRRARLPIHVRRRQARRLAVAIEAELQRMAAARLADLSTRSPAALAGERFGAGLAEAIRAVDRFSEDIVRGIARNSVADLGRHR